MESRLRPQKRQSPQPRNLFWRCPPRRERPRKRPEKHSTAFDLMACKAVRRACGNLVVSLDCPQFIVIAHTARHSGSAPGCLGALCSQSLRLRFRALRDRSYVSRTAPCVPLPGTREAEGYRIYIVYTFFISTLDLFDDLKYTGSRGSANSHRYSWAERMLPRGAAAGAKTLLPLAPAAAPQEKSSDPFLPAAVASGPEIEAAHDAAPHPLPVLAPAVLTGSVIGRIKLPAVRMLAGELRGTV